jgi:hypothetical protein
MGKTPMVLLGIGAFLAFALGCQSEGKIPFADDELAPDDSPGQGGSSGSSGASGRGGSGAAGSGGSAAGGVGGTSGGRGGSSGSSGSSGSGGSSGVSGSSGFGGTSSTGDSDIVGKGCDDDAECESIPDGYCASASICTATCVTHADCGCPAGTVNSDIAAGECSAACITYDDGTSFCQRVCSTGASCEGNSYCDELDFYAVCTPR